MLEFITLSTGECLNINHIVSVTPVYDFISNDLSDGDIYKPSVRIFIQGRVAYTVEADIEVLKRLSRIMSDTSSFGNTIDPGSFTYYLMKYVEYTETAKRKKKGKP